MGLPSPTTFVTPFVRRRAWGWSIVLILATLGFCALGGCFPRIMTLAGIGHDGVWFMDTYAILAALDAVRLGMDPYAYNPLNYFGGPHVYSHWWLWLEPTGWTRADTVWLGPLVVLVALVTIWWITRPRNGREALWMVLVICSAPIALGLNRANVDLLIFALLAWCVPCLLSPHRFGRVVGVGGLVALGMGLKFYPVFAAPILLAVRPRTDRIPALIGAAVLLLGTGWSVVPDVSHYATDRLPAGLFTFGAPTVFIEAGLSVRLAPWAGLGFLAVVGWLCLRRPGVRAWIPPPTLRREYLHFVLGAALLTGSFLVTVNYAYRWIFLIGMVPFLCRLDVADLPPFLRHLRAVTRGLMLVLVWADAVVALSLNLNTHSATEIEIWIARSVALQQPVLWLFFACLAGWLAHFGVQQACDRTGD